MTSSTPASQQNGADVVAPQLVLDPSSRSTDIGAYRDSYTGAAWERDARSGAAFAASVRKVIE